MSRSGEKNAQVENLIWCILTALGRNLNTPNLLKDPVALVRSVSFLCCQSPHTGPALCTAEIGGGGNGGRRHSHETTPLFG